MPASGILDATRGLSASVDELLAAPLTTPSSPELMQAMEELETQRRRLEAVDQQLVAQLAERYTAGDFGATDTRTLLIQRLRISPGEAKARVARAQDLGPRRELTGAPLPPLLPLTSAAVASGEISASGHACVIAKAVDRIPADLAADAVAIAEAFLVEAARHQDPRALATTAELLLARLDPDGRAPRDEENERRRDLTLIRNADGSGVARGSLTAGCAAALQTVLDALSAPRSSRDADGNETPDRRSAGQRRHDALNELILRVLRSGDLPAAGGMPVTILALTTMSDLVARTEAAGGHSTALAQIQSAGAKTWAGVCAGSGATRRAEAVASAGLGHGVARTGHGDVISLEQLLAMATDAEIIPVFCNDTGGIVAFGRGKRLGSRGQRLVLAARDRGCVMIGCDRPAAWTEVHHVIPWQDGGPTDVDNMCLLCTHHHHTFEAQGWSIVMRDGVPHCIPPPWIDAERKPVRNTAHHLPEIDFSPAAAAVR